MKKKILNALGALHGKITQQRGPIPSTLANSLQDDLNNISKLVASAEITDNDDPVDDLSVVEDGPNE